MDACWKIGHMPLPPIDQIRRNAESGQTESQFLLSQICLQNKDFEGMMRWLQEASAGGLADAHAALGHCHEKGTGIARNLEMALELYDQAIAGGSIPALYSKAELLYKSEGGPDKADEIRRLLRSAADAGFPPAQRAVSYITAQSGHTGFELPDSVALYPTSHEHTRTDYNADPAVAVCDDVLTADDCAYLVSLSRPYLTSSDVINPKSRQDGMTSDVRTSSGTYIPFELVDIIGRYIELKIVLAVGEKLQHSEPMSILRYAPGEYYKPHHDYFDPKLPVTPGLLEDGGQRSSSAVTYLAVPDSGGGTSFPELSVTIPPKLGATLWFRNCDDDGSINPRSLHAGDTVTQGEKWVVTKWFRERSTRYMQL